MKMNRKHLTLLLLLAGLAIPGGLGAATVTLDSVADTTLSQGNPDNNYGSLSSSFSGTTAGASVFRTLIRFDISSIPAGALIVSAKLDGTVDKARAGGTPYELHRVTAEWGEGAKLFQGRKGFGQAASTGEATWNSRQHGTATWSQAGGDFVTQASGTGSLGFSGPFTLTGSGLATDVQAWLDGTESNFGWILRATDEVSTSKAHLIGSREGAQAIQLTVDFMMPPSRPMLAAPISMVGGAFKLSVSTTQDTKTVIEFSTDLKLWDPIFTNNPAPSMFDYTDENAAGKDQRFYRAIIPNVAP